MRGFKEILDPAYTSKTEMEAPASGLKWRANTGNLRFPRMRRGDKLGAF